MVLDTLTEALDALVATDPIDLANGESMVALQCQLNRLEAVVTKATAEFETWGEWAEDGAKDATAWVATRCRLPKVEVRSRVALARKLCQMETSTQAWSRGEISRAHVQALASAKHQAVEGPFGLCEPALVEMAKEVCFAEFARRLAYWNQLADPDGCEESADRQRADRNVTLHESESGMFSGRITLDPISGSIVSDELARLEKRFFEADWAEAKARLGFEPKVGDLARTPAQRRADALVEMAVRSKDAPEGGRHPGPLFTVVVDYSTTVHRICELIRGTVVTPGSLLPYLDHATIERVVFKMDGRIEVSEKSRFFTGATRRAIEVRDQHCTHPYCDEPAEHCEVDHIVPFAHGGPTTQANGRLLCAFHHRLRIQQPRPDG